MRPRSDVALQRHERTNMTADGSLPARHEEMRTYKYAEVTVALLIDDRSCGMAAVQLHSGHFSHFDINSSQHDSTSRGVSLYNDPAPCRRVAIEPHSATGAGRLPRSLQCGPFVRVRVRALVGRVHGGAAWRRVLGRVQDGLRGLCWRALRLCSKPAGRQPCLLASGSWRTAC